ncbi:hypothetical protein AWW66_22700 [Micromonospora rosaria]|uniref:S-adenosyl methyltransferase n=1 Tax=Micromonospora rosaria TaxID=47874 RepID=A0A136PMS1_9ACTN|nr:SAM-dependent methyltransferase [Micromonospora rosaria]KXK59745.1 hypothetical protein AWW66_22700 [Micromonospora rosaria]
MAIPQTPNTGRILDYWLGGDHRFPPDQGAAAAFDAIYPEFPRLFGTLRQFIGRAARAVADQGIDQFLVLGAGIPTKGNVHEAVPGARVLYTDIDATNIELGRSILAGLPQVEYAYCDASDLDTLDRDAADRVLRPAEPLGVVMVGVSVFLDDATVRATLARIYDRVPSGSFLVADFDGEALNSYPDVVKILDQAGEPLYLRGPDRIAPLLGRWRLTDDGIRPVDTWRDDTAAHPEKVFMYGCLATKP